MLRGPSPIHLARIQENDKVKQYIGYILMLTDYSTRTKKEETNTQYNNSSTFKAAMKKVYSPF